MKRMLVWYLPTVLEKIPKLSRFDREQLVLERLQKNRVWDDLNNFEKDFAIRYVEKLKPKTTTPAPGVKND